MVTKVYTNGLDRPLSARALALINKLEICSEALTDCHPTLEGLSKLLGVHRTTIDGDVRELKDKDYLKTTKVTRDDERMETRFLVKTGRLIPREINSPSVFSELMEAMYNGISVKHRDKKLSPINLLLVALLMSAEDAVGSTKLSQTEIMKMIGFSEPQLKSQMNKLENLGVLQKLVSGGTFNGVTGRAKSKLRLNYRRLKQLLKLSFTEGVSAISEDRPKASRITLSSPLNFATLFKFHLNESNIPWSRSTPCKPKEILPKSICSFVSVINPNQLRYNRHLADLSIFYATLALTELPDEIIKIKRRSFSDYPRAIAESDLASQFNEKALRLINDDLGLSQIDSQNRDVDSSDESGCTEIENFESSQDSVTNKSTLPDAVLGITWSVLLDKAITPDIISDFRTRSYSYLKLTDFRSMEILVCCP